MKIKHWIMDKKTFIMVVFAAIIGFFVGQQRFFNQPAELLLQTQKQKTNRALPNSPISHEEYYVCPMHPEVISDSPGTCPICGMDLVKYPHSHSHKLAQNHSTYPAIHISPAILHNLGIRTIQVKPGNLQHNIETIGKITRIDLTARRIITPPVSGTLSYIANKYDGDQVNTGELLFTISSSRLQEQQRQFQQLYSTDKTAAAAMIPQLLQSGLTTQQISQLQAGQPPEFPIEIYAKEPGYIFSRRGEKGDSIPSGFTVFNIGSNYRVVEVTAEIFESEWNWIKKGQAATMTVRGLPGVSFSGKVVRVEPPVGYTTRSLEVALKFKTAHPGLSQSTFAHVSIKGKVKHHILWVPRDTVIQTSRGDRVVVLREDGLYQPVVVVTGEQSDDKVEIISGLKQGDTVVASGQFLIDSESNLQSALQRMTPHNLSHIKKHKPAEAL